MIFCQKRAVITNYLFATPENCQNRGSEEHALGALMRMLRASVGAILSIVTGSIMRSAWLPAPKNMMGNCMNEALDNSL